MIALARSQRHSPHGLVLVGLCLLGLASPLPVFGQAPVLNPEEDPLAQARSLLTDVQDHVFSFDDEAFYWFCRHVRRGNEGSERASSTQSPDAPASAPVAWRSLLERPSDYRGQCITVEGTLLTFNGFTVSGPGREDVGTLYQCELANPDTRGFCTIITTQSPERIPIRSRVRGSGYFVKIRAYQTNRGETGQAPLIVARCLEDRTPHTPPLVPSRTSTRWIIPATAALAMGYLLLRRRLRRSHQPRRTAGDDGGTPVAPAGDDFAWMTELPEENASASISDDA